MRSFFRTIIVIVLLIGTFVGGWYSSSVIKQDPFISNFFPIKNEPYARFVQDLTAVIQDMRMTDQSQLVEQLLNTSFISNLSQPTQPNDYEIPDAIEVHGTVPKDAFESIDAPEIQTDVEVYDVESVLAVDPSTMIGGIVKQMSVKEKLTFLLWAKSRFTDEQLREIEQLLQNEITPDSFLTLYQFTRKSLKGDDFEYLLSFVDRYLNTLQPAPEDAIPVFQSKESSMNKPN